MRGLLTDAWRTLLPGAEERDGPLPPLLLVLTVVTGLVDAVSYLALGHVFVANMTGNVVFLGFALAGADELSAPASVVALLTFLAGALVGGRLGSRFAGHRARLLAAATALETLVTAIALIVTAMADGQVTTTVRYTLIVSLGTAMGVQNAVARRLGVPDLTTTVLTLTLTGLAADTGTAGGPARRPGRRILSVLAMFLGALLGGVLVLGDRLVAVLGLCFVLLAVTSLAIHRHSRTDAPWAHPPH
ncbi:YoaK family protein [Streptomyces sp. NPDC126514]|uniref:YoaK family protein n=1 Tax=Streptomyces sp. NPDC126514 TaxID=3155210 RepID=UPI0033325836